MRATVALLGAIIALGASAVHADVIEFADVTWEKLNPARGDASPQAATLWGDRNAAVPTGFLARFADGFSSPPHIHNATYRAVVIRGTIHNDDPNAKPMWMPPGSFWTQPKGEVHITSAKGKDNLALVEIDRGPYLVMPPAEAFDSGERPINVVTDNVVWLDPQGWASAGDGPQVAYLWGRFDRNRPNGTFVRLPAGSAATLSTAAANLHGVVIQGELHISLPSQRALQPGSYFGSGGKALRVTLSSDAHETIVYLKSDGSYSLLKAD